LLHKHPERLHSRESGFGSVHIFYPEASEERCTCALLLQVDPVGLVRGRKNAASDFSGLDNYVNDRPYVASSFLSVAIGRVFREAMNGQSKERPQLTDVAMPLQAHLPAVPCRGGEEFLRRLFEPLGYDVQLQSHTLDHTFSQWGQSPYFSLTLQAQTRLRDLLTHLYVLIPVLDDDKHYWVGEDEVEKLLRRGEGG
jgi:3' terminal RNA ribose 2'-O-methyltransferase Hen1